MKIVAIRHGEPDYNLVEQKGFIGHGHDLAPLTALGIQQALEMTKSSLLEEVELLVSSSYTRALQTAAILSRIRQLPLSVEIDLHE